MSKPYIECGVVMLPTSDFIKGIITKSDEGDFIGLLDNVGLANMLKSDTPQHLYFTSNELIKEGDWFYASDHKSVNINRWKNHMDIKDEFPFYFKIVASTDPSLNLPAIHKSFLKVYVKANGNIKNVRLKKAYQNPKDSLSNYHLELTLNNEVIVLEEEPHTIYTHPEENGPRLDEISRLLGELNAILNKPKIDTTLEDAAKKSFEEHLIKDHQDKSHLSYGKGLWGVSFRIWIRIFKIGFKSKEEQSANDAVKFAEWIQTQGWEYDHDKRIAITRKWLEEYISPLIGSGALRLLLDNLIKDQSPIRNE